MPNDIEKQIIAFVFKRKGKTQISESEFYLTISMQLQWCTPHHAKQFVQYVLQDGLLIKKDDMLSANFSIKDVSIPVGFKPSSVFFETYTTRQPTRNQNKKQDLQSYIISSSSSKEDVEKEINNLMHKKRILKPAALLYYAKKHNIYIDDFIDTVEQQLLTKNKG